MRSNCFSGFVCWIIFLSCKLYLTSSVVCLPFPWLLHSWIRSTLDSKHLEQNCTCTENTQSYNNHFQSIYTDFHIIIIWRWLNNMRGSHRVYANTAPFHRCTGGSWIAENFYVCRDYGANPSECQRMTVLIISHLVLHEGNGIIGIVQDLQIWCYFWFGAQKSVFSQQYRNLYNSFIFAAPPPFLSPLEILSYFHAAEI